MSLPPYQYQLMGMAQEARKSVDDTIKSIYGEKKFFLGSRKKR